MSKVFFEQLFILQFSSKHLHYKRSSLRNTFQKEFRRSFQNTKPLFTESKYWVSFICFNPKVHTIFNWYYVPVPIPSPSTAFDGKFIIQQLVLNFLYTVFIYKLLCWPLVTFIFLFWMQINAKLILFCNAHCLKDLILNITWKEKQRNWCSKPSHGYIRRNLLWKISFPSGHDFEKFPAVFLPMQKHGIIYPMLT